MASQIDEISPKEWNNVPICVTDFLQQVLKYIFLDCRHNSYLEKSCEELAQVARINMDYSERMVDELVRKVNNKVKQINSKMEIDVVQANADVLNKVLKQIPMAVENSKKEFEVSLNKAVESIQEWVDKRGVALNRKIEHMLDHKI